ncbi:MAG: PTS mannose/fructose/sorbose/N-acetylgalactosamine transporter subunit IIC [Bacilli bacterium]
MFLTAILVGLVGVFCILDSRLLGRLNFERPLITSTIVGILLGDLQTGLEVGATLELMSLGLVNIGAATPVDMNIASIITVAFVILTDATAETALALSVPIALLGQSIGIVVRLLLANLTHVADNAIKNDKFKKARNLHIVWGVFCYAISYFIPIFIAIYFGSELVEKIVQMIPEWLTLGLTLSTKFLTAYGIALLLSMMLKKSLTPYFILGFFLIAYFNVDITAVAIFATIIAIVVGEMKFANSNDKNLEDFDPLEDFDSAEALGGRDE